MDEGMSGFCLTGGAKCGRWNPTTEQVKVLTDLFRSGLRTPSTDQIQNISSHLSFYGKIESKNVFYWFQNHKARERQKRRRISIPHHDTNHFLIPSSKYHGEDEVGLHEGVVGMEKERVIETLQLFPMKSGCEEGEKVWWRSARKEMNQTFSHSLGKDDYPPLELRLSTF